MAAVCQKSLPMAELLLSYGANVNDRNKINKSCMQYVGSTEITKLLLCYGGNYYEQVKNILMFSPMSCPMYLWPYSTLIYCLDKISMPLDCTTVDQLYSYILADAQEVSSRIVELVEQIEFYDFYMQPT